MSCNGGKAGRDNVFMRQFLVTEPSSQSTNMVMVIVGIVGSGDSVLVVLVLKVVVLLTKKR